MAHILELFDPSRYVSAHELKGKDVTVTIERVVAATVEGEGNRKARKPVIHFKNASKPLVLNKTNAKAIVGMYGADYTKWNGKRITIYPTTTSLAGATVDCIRVRPKPPGTSVQDSPPIVATAEPSTAGEEPPHAE